jgi:hypothetical protein
MQGTLPGGLRCAIPAVATVMAAAAAMRLLLLWLLAVACVSMSLVVAAAPAVTAVVSAAGAHAPVPCWPHIWKMRLSSRVPCHTSSRAAGSTLRPAANHSSRLAAAERSICSSNRAGGVAGVGEQPLCYQNGATS